MKKPMTYFLYKLKDIKPKAGRQNGMTRVTRKKLVKIMEEKQLICIDGLIYDENDKIVGKVQIKTSNEVYITREEFEKLPLRELMRLLGTLDKSLYGEYRNTGIKSSRKINKESNILY